MGKPLIDLPNSFFEEEFLHGARREIMELVRKINAAEDQWALTAYKLESYREALSGSNGDSDEVIVFEFGAGITYLFNFLLIKSHFPQSSLRYIAVDADAMAEMKHHSVYRGNEITYLTGDASKIDWLQVESGVGSGRSDIVILDRPVICTPEEYHAFSRPEAREMSRTLEDQNYTEEVRRQNSDFEGIISETVPHFLRSGGLVLASSLLAEEFPELERRFLGERFSDFSSQLVCSRLGEREVSHQ